MPTESLPVEEIHRLIKLRIEALWRREEETRREKDFLCSRIIAEIHGLREELDRLESSHPHLEE